MNNLEDVGKVLSSKEGMARRKGLNLMAEGIRTSYTTLTQFIEANPHIAAIPSLSACNTVGGIRPGDFPELTDNLAELLITIISRNNPSVLEAEHG